MILYIKIYKSQVNVLETYTKTLKKIWLGVYLQRGVNIYFGTRKHICQQR